MFDFRLFWKRRRRVRLIQNLAYEADQASRSAPVELAVASEAESHRNDITFLRERLIRDCQPISSAKLRAERKGSPPLEIGLGRPFLIVGRHQGCDLRLDHPQISLRQLLLLWIEGRLFCCDIAPAKGLFSRPVASSIGQWVDGRPMIVGPYRLQIANASLTPSGNSPLDRCQQLTNHYPLLALRFDGVAQSENVWAVDRVLTLIGRSAACKLRLNHPSLAPVQACLLRTPTGCWLIDLAGNGGTQVNGQTVAFAAIDPGDELQLGCFFAEVGTLNISAPTATPAAVAINQPRPPAVY